MRDQAENLRIKIETLKTQTKAKTIAVVSGKGGVGKSNFSLNFSLALAKKGYKVLLFDLDIGMGNIDILLGLTSKHTIVDMFNEDLSIRDIIEKGPENLSYIAGGTGLTSLFKLDEMKLNHFIAQLASVIGNYHYMIFDIGAGASEGNIQFALSAHQCFVVTTPEPTSLTDAYAMMKFISLREKSSQFHLLVNRSTNSKEGNMTMKRLSHVVKHFLDIDIVPLGILSDDRIVQKAVGRQVPFLLYDQKALVSREITDIVERYVSDSLTEKVERSPFQFIAKLRQYFVER